MDFKDISPELHEKAKACTSPEELVTLIHEEGYELTDAELEAISGGLWSKLYGCPEYKARGDSRTDIDSAYAHADFANGLVDGGEEDW